MASCDEAFVVTQGGALASADLGCSSRYSIERKRYKQTPFWGRLRAGVEKVSAPTAVECGSITYKSRDNTPVVRS